MNYEVIGIVPKQYSNEIAGGDIEMVKNFNHKSKAFAFAKSESKKAKWWEVQVRQTDDDDEVQKYWCFQGGKLTFSDTSI